MDKQIEEMAKVRIGAILEKINLGDGYADIESVADEIYHIAIPEGAVVLTKEEYDKLQALKGDYVKGYEAGVEEGWDNARKETAEKFAEKLKDEVLNFCGTVEENGYFETGKKFFCDDIDEIAKEIIGGNDDDTSEVGK